MTSRLPFSTLTGLGMMLLLMLSGCLFDFNPSGDRYTMVTDPNDRHFKIVTMKTTDPESREFTFRFDKRLWEIEEWPEEQAINGVALIHRAYEDGSCNILPGTMGKGMEEGSQFYEGSLLTESHTARTIEVKNAAGIRVLYAVGYEIDDIPYIFEVNFPIKDQEACERDAQPVVSSFEIVGEEGSEGSADDEEGSSADTTEDDSTAPTP